MMCVVAKTLAGSGLFLGRGIVKVDELCVGARAVGSRLKLCSYERRSFFLTLVGVRSTCDRIPARHSLILDLIHDY
jgi:hypothetical protein